MPLISSLNRSISTKSPPTNLWQLRRAKHALAVIDNAEARHTLWLLSEPGKYSTDDDQYSAWGLKP
jgi:uncharacterized protein YbdZ (MbtH family)